MTLKILALSIIGLRRALINSHDW